MSSSNGSAAVDMIDLIRDLIIEQLNLRDNIEVCKIYSVNNDGTYNIVIPPDEVNVVTNIKSISSESLHQKDYAYILKIKNKLNNSLILTRIGPGAASNRTGTSSSENLQGKLDIQINGHSIVEYDIANILTHGAYSATNKMATMSDLPTISVSGSLVSGATEAKSINVNGTNWNLPDIYIVEQYYASAGAGYRIWSNGWVEQWGTLEKGASYNSSTTNVEFAIEFADTDYNAFATALEGANYIDGAWVTGREVKKMIVHTGHQASTAHQLKCNWYAFGFKAQGA